jgi:hypothetical protein
MPSIQTQPNRLKHNLHGERTPRSTTRATSSASDRTKDEEPDRRLGRSVDPGRSIDSARSIDCEKSTDLAHYDALTQCRHRVGKSGDRVKRRKITVGELRVASWNVGTMSGRSLEVTDALSRRRVQICCVQESRWKGEGARTIGPDQARYKFFWKGRQEGLGGVGILIAEEMADEVIEVKRLSDRVMYVRMSMKRGILRIVSAYAPQSGRTAEEKEEFWNTLKLALVGLDPEEERVVIAGDLNGHVGEETNGYNGTHGGRGVGVRNEDGETILRFAEASEMIVVNTSFDKPLNRRATYSSGGAETQVDYMMVFRRERKNIRNISVVKSEECIQQHRLLIMDWQLRPLVKRAQNRIKRIKIWR